MYCFCISFLYFLILSKRYDLINQHIYMFFLSLFYLKGWVIVHENWMFTTFRIHNYSIYSFLNLLYCYILFSNFFFLDTKNIWLIWFYLVRFQIYYLLLLVQVLSVTFETEISNLLVAFVYELVFSVAYGSRPNLKYL